MAQKKNQIQKKNNNFTYSLKWCIHKAKYQKWTQVDESV